jgi:raffinose/stachyose/melibiose transport system permease protein
MSTTTPSASNRTPQRGRPNRIAPAFYWMTIPALVLFLVFLVFPFAQGIFYTFTNYPGYGDWDFIGLRNYSSLLRDEVIWQSYGFTFRYAITGTILVNVLAMLIALGLNSKIAGRDGWRAVFFLPYILPVLIVGYVFQYLFTFNVPEIGAALGIEALSTSMLADPDLAWVPIVVVGVWQSTAFSVIIYLAGLQTVPAEVYEAGAIDGATGWKRFWELTFPLILPYFTINMVLTFKTFLGVFDQIVAMTNGGPGTSTQSVAFLIFRNGFQGGEYAYQTANGVIYFLVLIVLSMTQLLYFQRREAKYQ